MLRDCLSALVALAGCDKVLGLQPLPPPDALPDAAPDVPLPDAPLCVMPALYDAFDSDPVCAPIGFADNDATTTVSSVNGRLAIAPGANTASTRGGCLGGNVAFAADAGVFMHVTSLPDGSEYQFMALYWSGSSTSTMVSWNTSDIIVQRARMPNDPAPVMVGDILFDSTMTTWVRVRPTVDGTAIVAESSPDGLHWTVFGTDTVTPPTEARVTMYGGTFASESAPRTIYFDDFDVCPL